MADKKRATGLIGMGLVGLLCVTGGCGNNKKPTPTSTPGGNDRSNLNPPGEQSGKNVVITKCRNLPLDACGKTLFGDKRCKRDGKNCVEDNSSKPPETCSELSDDDCTKSLVCTFDAGAGCREDNTFLLPPCKDKNLKDCSGECRRDTILPVCLANKEAIERKGRCVFRTELCNPDAACLNLYANHCKNVREAPPPVAFSINNCVFNPDFCKHFNPNTESMAGIKLGDSELNVADAAVQVCSKDTTLDAPHAKINPAASGECARIVDEWLTAGGILAGPDRTPELLASVCSIVPTIYNVESQGDIVGDNDAAGGGSKTLGPDGLEVLVADGAGSNELNIPGWCRFHQEQANIANTCRVNTAVMAISNLCNKTTRAECEAVPQINENVPCAWREQ